MNTDSAERGIPPAKQSFAPKGGGGGLAVTAGRNLIIASDFSSH